MMGRFNGMKMVAKNNFYVINGSDANKYSKKKKKLRTQNILRKKKNREYPDVSFNGIGSFVRN